MNKTQAYRASAAATAAVRAYRRAKARKASPGDVQQAVGQLMSYTQRLISKGKGSYEPANSVYTPQEIYQIGKQARVIIGMAQSLPNRREGATGLRQIIGALKQINEAAVDLVKTIQNPKRDADRAAEGLRYIAKDLKNIISDIGRIGG